MPVESKYVLIFAWQTSNWDLFYGVLVAFALKLDIVFLAKKELFRWPFRPSYEMALRITYRKEGVAP